MSPDNDQTNSPSPEFDFSAFPGDSLFYDRRHGRDRRARTGPPAASPPETARRPAPERREKKERRKRIDPTTFEKQYTDDEMEFMNAMQRFKEVSGKAFPSHRDVLKVAIRLGYRRATFEYDHVEDGFDDSDPSIILASTEPL